MNWTPHNSRAFENENELTRRVFSSRISVRVIGGSARWLQFSRSQSRQLTPIGVPSALSRSMFVLGFLLGAAALFGVALFAALRNL